jgi:hypothetical protein
MAKSIRILKKKTGIVIFVGNAARLVTSDIAIAEIAKAHKIMLFPLNKMARTVMGVKIQP